MYNGERPIGAAKGKQTNTLASCQPPHPRPVMHFPPPCWWRAPSKCLDFVWSMPAPAWEGRQGMEGAPVTVPLTPTENAFPHCFCGQRIDKITLGRLLDQSHAGPYIWENATYPPIFGPLWAYSRTLPQG